MINVCREEFDEEKEPDGMILSGWTPALATEKNKTSDNGPSSSNASQTVPLEPEDEDEIEIILKDPEILAAGKKRKSSDVSLAAGSEITSATGEMLTKSKVEEDDSHSDIVMVDGNLDTTKKKRVQ